MRTPLLLLKIIGKVALHTSGVGGIWSIVVDDVTELANNVWIDWKATGNPAQRRADLEAVAVLDDNVNLEKILDEIAADQPAPVREALAVYLRQIPASVRQSMRRPDDVTGRTVPPAREPRSGEDMIPFLAAQRPQLKAGDRPIPGADWELVELLGIGGYGEVWKARHVHIPEFGPVALKFLKDPEAREFLLKQEGAVCARLQKEGRHPGIVALRNTYLRDELPNPCLEFEFIDGGTLAGLIQDWSRRQPPSTPEEMTQPLLKIAEVVAFTHGLNPPIAHRDLKPSNIMVQGLNGSTRFLITDFGIGGIASSAVVRETRRSTRTLDHHTKAAVTGACSLLYASPEQARGGNPNPSDDVHALGVIWYQMLTGDLSSGPPTGQSWREDLRERGMPAELIHLLETCLNKAEKRPPNAAVFLEQIKKIVDWASWHGEMRRFEGQAGLVHSLVFSPDGESFLSGNDDGSIIHWNVKRREEVRRFRGGSNRVYALAFAPDGKSFISAEGLSGDLKLWNLASGEEIRRFRGHEGSVFDAAFSPVGGSMVSAGSDGTVRLWEVASGREEKRFKGHRGFAYRVAFSKDGGSILSSGCDDGTIRRWDVAKRRETRSIKLLQGTFSGLVFATSGNIMISGRSNEGTMRVWDLNTDRELRKLEGHQGGVRCLAFAPNGRLALSGGSDGTIRLWDVPSGREVQRFEGHERGVLCVAFSPDARTALSGGFDQVIRQWRLPD